MKFINNTDIIINKSQKQTFETEWNFFVTEIVKVFNLTQKEFEWLSNCKTAKLIAAIPFAAKCNEPERTAIAHLCIYIAEIKGFQKYYSHTSSDDSNIYHRLDFISNFEEGDINIINYGINLLALSMLEGYKKSYDFDKENNIYNPLVSGVWNYHNLKYDLQNKINGITNSIIDALNYVPSEGWDK